MQIDKTKPVFLNGSTGYVGGRIAEKLLQEGQIVHAPIRDPNTKEKTKYLDELADKLPGKIVYFKADLLTPNSYDEAMTGCELVIHTASPFIRNTKNPQKDLIEPALNGTENVLNSVNNTPSVKRIVLTSSCAAIYGDAKDIRGYQNQIMTEDNWNETSSLTTSPYNYSKTLAEKKAWEMQKAQQRWDLVVINPSFILGPGINPSSEGESYSTIKQMGDGELKLGAPDLEIGCVDVRDVAEAHYRAGFTPEAAGRHIISAENLSFLQLADMLRPKYGKDFSLPSRTLSKWLLWLLGPTIGISRQFVRDNVGHPWRADNTKSKEKLGIEYRSINETINEFFQHLLDHGVIKK